MDELHATIAGYLRAEREQHERRVCAIEDRILNVWRKQWMVPQCKVCGAAADDDEGGLYNLTNMRDERRCAHHYVSF